MNLPEGLSAADQHLLRKELRHVTREKERLEAELPKLAQRKQGIETHRARLTARLSRLSPAASNGSSATTDATWSTAIVGEKRARPHVEESAAVPPPATVAPRGEQQHVATEGGKAVPSRRPALARGAAFGVMRGVLANAVKDNKASAALDQQRQAQRHEVERKEVEADLQHATREFAEVSTTHEAGQTRLQAVTAEFGPLQRVVADMRAAEEAFADAHFLKADGQHYSVSFAPIRHTQHSQVLLDDQLLQAAMVYTDTFRRQADTQLARIRVLQAERFAAREAARPPPRRPHRGGGTAPSGGPLLPHPSSSGRPQRQQPEEAGVLASDGVRPTEVAGCT